MITLYKILKDEYGEGKNDEVCVGEFKSATDLAEKFFKDGIKISSRAINKAVQKSYIIKEQYLVFRFLD